MVREGKALAARKADLPRLGAGFLGILGDANHSFGFHIPLANLRRPDYSSTGSRNVGPRDAGCAMDTRVTKVSRDILGNPVPGWPAAAAYLRWLRIERKAGRVYQTAELIGSLDGNKASYAADSTNWEWTPYTGSGHVDWQHEAVYRKYADDATYRARTFGKWGPRGLLVKPPAPKPKPKPTAKRYFSWTTWFNAYSYDVLTAVRVTLPNLIKRTDNIEARLAELEQKETPK